MGESSDENSVPEETMFLCGIGQFMVRGSIRSLLIYAKYFLNYVVRMFLNGNFQTFKIEWY